MIEGYSDYDIAIVGMACRFPGARDKERFWELLMAGREASTFFKVDELIQRGVSERVARDPHYVPACMVMPDLEAFDSEFFGLSPKEAGIMDPQHRHFLETCWEALEDAGHMPSRFEGSIGLFAGSGMSAYFMYNILSNPELLDSVGLFLLRHTGNDKDFLATRVSYALNLTGPSINVQTACSTSLVAVHMGCQSLLAHECDLVLAGGVTIELPHYQGYMFREGEILSPDGHCRAFDHRSRGTIFGSGAGAVVLRRLADALAGPDRIYAVVRGSALNNDGAGKVGYLAPSVDGQAAAVSEALAMTELSADSIDYIECHGTGTAVGDPIEVAALTRAFRETTDARGFCGLGSVKTNIGHLDTAAGVAGLIKTTLALYHGKIPPTINFERANPNIDFASSPFYVVDRVIDWPKRSGPRRAGVNSLGVGGTNAHVVLQEAPPRDVPVAPQRGAHLLAFAARQPGSLDEYGQRLAAHLANGNVALADVTATLLRGRERFEHRRVLAVADHADAVAQLHSGDPRRVFTHRAGAGAAAVAFMFPGGGVQYPDMAKGLYQSESIFRQFIDAGLNLLTETEDRDFRALLFPEPEQRDAVARELMRPSLQLPLIFLVEYAMARLLMAKGIAPTALIGHSLGENTAACLAGVFSFADALGLVCLRGRLFETLPPGGMISVQSARGPIEEILPDGLDLAVVNSPEVCVVSGSVAALERFGEVLVQRGFEHRHIHIDVAAHSRLLEPMLQPFGDYLRSIRLGPPTIPFVSNRTGTWITAEQATNPQYWVDHLRHTVFFAEGIGTLVSTSDRLLLEVGPGTALTSLARQHPDIKNTRGVIPTLRHPEDRQDDALFFLAALGRLWACGVPVPEEALGLDPARPHISLPSYAFRHKNYWIEPGKSQKREQVEDALPARRQLDDWFYRPTWKEHRLELDPEATGLTWLLFVDAMGIGTVLAERLTRQGHTVITVREGDTFLQLGERAYALSPESGQNDYTSLVRALVANGQMPDRICHLWMLTIDSSFRPGSSFFHRNQERGFYSLFFLAKAMLEEEPQAKLNLIVAVNGMHQVAEEALVHPDKATLLGPANVIPREFPGSTCTTLDIVLPEPKRTFFQAPHLTDEAIGQVADRLLPELLARLETSQLALRGNKRLRQTFQSQMRSAAPPTRLREQGHYLITGALGGIGLVIARHLARQYRARLLLIARPGFPEREAWPAWLASHGSGNRTSARIRLLQTLEEQGAELIIAAVDVTDLQGLREALARAESRFGALRGVFHAAGVLRDSPIAVKTQSEVEQVFTPKVHGTLVLDELLAERKLEFMVLFSSSSTVLAPPGQCDYVAANAFLDAYATSRAERHGAIAIAWGTWNRVGMTENLVESGAAETTVLAASHPLLATRRTDSRGHSTFNSQFSTATWVLGEHRTIGGNALLPGTGYLELARAALAEQGETRTFEISDLYFLRPLQVSDRSHKEVRIRLRPEREEFQFSIQSLYQPEVGPGGWETHAEARLAPCGPPAQSLIDLAAIRARCPREQRAAPGSALRTKQFDHLRLGKRWHCIRAIHYGRGEALAEIQLDKAFLEDVKGYFLHPALLDMATGFPMELIEGYEDSHELWVPVSYGRVRVYGRLPGRIIAWARNNGLNSMQHEVATFDIAIADEHGKLLLAVDAFSVKRMAGDPDFDVFHQPSAQDLEYDQNSSSGALSPAEQALRHNVETGITPEEGVQALERALAGHGSRLLVSPLDLDALLRQTEELSRERAATGHQFARPDLESEYVAPTDDIERKLVSFWEDLLGVDQVGVEDSFFELGGHSLIAVRLFAGIKKAFQVEFPISVLFEAPTIRKVAELVRQSRPSAGFTLGDRPAALRKRHTHLVAMHAGSPGAKTPFFLVAGMFGNVLNLRHLAHLIGTDRPFYGLQARGLYGGEEPHRDFATMAADYLAEMRLVQEKGPYLIGGFSGGGITALELAHQLNLRGEEVQLLVFLDTPLPVRPSLGKWDKLAIHRQNLGEQGVGYLRTWAENRLRWEVGKWRRRKGGAVVEPTNSDFHSAAIESAFREALQDYQLRSYPGKITLFRPKLDQKYRLSGGRVVSSDLEFVVADNGWTPWAASLEVHEVPGNHDSMVLEPNVRTLAAKLAACIEAAERSS